MDLGKTIGGVLIVGATLAVCFWPKAEKPAADDQTVRPIRSQLVGRSARMPDLSFVGTVKAKESRTLAFKQSGRIERIPIANGQQVRKGEKLAWLDPLDFEHRLVQAEAAVKRDRLSYQRKSDAAKKNAVSQEEVSQAEAQLKHSESEYQLAKRALAETVLVAPFDCTIADVPASELDMVSPNTPVLSLLDLSTVKVDVVYPEAIVIRAKQLNSRPCTNDGLRISFDSLPGRSYPARFIEYRSLADTKTQTYLATYEMDAPEDLLLLPGMSATLTVRGDSYALSDEKAQSTLEVPESAVGVDADGCTFVWKLTETAERGIYEVHAVRVTVMADSTSLSKIVSGLALGDRVATAGVHILTEGRKVSLMKD